MTKQSTRNAWRFSLVVRGLLLAAMVLGPASYGWALITGGVGNDPIENRQWPAGAAEVFNTKARVASCPRSP